MKSRNEQASQDAIRTYYVVCPPFLLEKNWTPAVIFDLAEKWLSQKNNITIYTDKAQAMFTASQFTSVPSEYDERQHILEKPVLCIPLEIMTDLPKKNNAMFFARDKGIHLDEYGVDAAKFKNCSSTKWIILFDNLELAHPHLNQDLIEKVQATPFGMQ